MILNKKTLAIILAGGKGTRLKNLTHQIAKPAISFGSKYRIIDFTLSNCINSGIEDVGVITQYQPYILNNYINNGLSWGLTNIDILQPYINKKSSKWFNGTAHAIYQNIEYIDKKNPEYLLILSGDHIYEMDYNKMLEQHKKFHANLTVAVRDVSLKEASRFGIMKTDDNNRIVEFEEKPKYPKSNHASMGIYIFTWKRLREVLKNSFNKDKEMIDFGKNVIPYYINSGDTVIAYPFSGYWRDVGTVESLWEANMELIGGGFYYQIQNDQWPIYYHDVLVPPTKVAKNAEIKKSLLANGCFISGKIEHSVIAENVTIQANSIIKNSVIMPNVSIGKNVFLDHVVVGEDSIIGDQRKIIGKKGRIIAVKE